jgi:hypothetical protein
VDYYPEQLDIFLVQNGLTYDSPPREIKLYFDNAVISEKTINLYFNEKPLIHIVNPIFCKEIKRN